MVLSDREKIAIIVAHVISLYSENLRDGKIPQNQSVIDFVFRNIPAPYKTGLDMDLIDDVITFISSQHMELS